MRKNYKLAVLLNEMKYNKDDYAQTDLFRRVISPDNSIEACANKVDLIKKKLRGGDKSSGKIFRLGWHLGELYFTFKYSP